MKSQFLIFSILLIILSSCQKYEEGPKISLRSKENRFCQTWVLKKTIYPDGSQTETSISIEYEFKTNGEYTVSSDGDITTVNWEFEGDTGLKLFSGTLYIETFEILRLSKDELILKTDLYENHFIVKE